MDVATSESDHVIVFNMDGQDQNHDTDRSLESHPNPPQTLRRLSFSKPKARFSLPIIEEHKNNLSDEEFSEDEEEEYDEEGHKKEREKFKFKWRIFIEWILFIMISTSLACSLTILSLKNQLKCGLELWRWCLMILVVFSGRLVSGWITRLVVFFIERNFMLREKVLYFVYGLRKSIQNCVWLGLVLLSWTFIFNTKLQKNNILLEKIFQLLVAVLISATIWLVKIILVKCLASSFHVTTYFDRMKESVFHHYVLDTLSGPPMDEVAHRQNMGASQSFPEKYWESRVPSKRMDGTRKMDIEKLKRLSMQSTASAWTIKRLVNYVRFFGLSTISKTVDDIGRMESEITSEWDARICGKRIFNNVAKPGAK